MRDRATADDLIQEVATALWAGFARYDEQRPFIPWARGVAGNILKTHYGRAARGARILSPEAVAAIADVASAQQEPFATRDDERALRQCMTKLPTRSVQLLTLRYDHDLELSAIAVKAGIGVEGVRKALARLRRALRTCVEKRMGKAAVT